MSDLDELELLEALLRARDADAEVDRVVTKAYMEFVQGTYTAEDLREGISEKRKRVEAELVRVRNRAEDSKAAFDKAARCAAPALMQAARMYFESAERRAETGAEAPKGPTDG